MKISLDHASFAVSDIDAAISFLTQSLGFQLKFIERVMSGQIASMLGLPGATCDLAQLALPGAEFAIEVIKFGTELTGTANDLPVFPGMGHLAIKVEQFDVVLAALKDADARVLGEITQFEAGRAAYLKTSFGLFLELQEDRQGPEA